MAHIRSNLIIYYCLIDIYSTVMYVSRYDEEGNFKTFNFLGTSEDYNLELKKYRGALRLS